MKDDLPEKNIDQPESSDRHTKYLQEIKRMLPEELGWIVDTLPLVDGGSRLSNSLDRYFSPNDYLGQPNNSKAFHIWEKIGHYYRATGRIVDALNIYFAEYYGMVNAQNKTGEQIHKGTPLCWIHDMFLSMNHIVHAKRYLMLTLCEDAITCEGIIDPDQTGVYHRLSWIWGMPGSEISRYANEVFNCAMGDRYSARFPEWCLQQLDARWHKEYPTSQELDDYYINSYYAADLFYKLGEGEGKNLEKLTEYVISCVPGCRAEWRARTKSTDYDVVCVLEGQFLDFRSDINRYFVCECKDIDQSVGFTDVMKFSAVLEGIKTNFGIIVSRNGISGRGRNTDSERGLISRYQALGMVVVDLSDEDFKRIINGENLVIILREKYEIVRLDLY